MEESSDAQKYPHVYCKTKVGISPVTERFSCSRSEGEWKHGAGVFTRSFCHLLLKVATKEMTAHRELFAV